VDQVLENEQALRSLSLFDMPGDGVAISVLKASKAMSDLRLAAGACFDAWDQIKGVPDVNIPSRNAMDFGRAFEHALQICRTGRELCIAQVEKLRTLMPVQD